jgi:hypothetical protein
MKISQNSSTELSQSKNNPQATERSGSLKFLGGFIAQQASSGSANPQSNLRTRRTTTTTTTTTTTSSSNHSRTTSNLVCNGFTVPGSEGFQLCATKMSSKQQQADSPMLNPMYSWVFISEEDNSNHLARVINSRRRSPKRFTNIPTNSHQSSQGNTRSSLPPTNLPRGVQCCGLGCQSL